MQQREHTIIAAAVAVAGVAELLSSAIPALAYVWPAAIILTERFVSLSRAAWHIGGGRSGRAAASGFGYYTHPRRIAEFR